jgi:hypothetical membrane protein
MRRWLPLFGVLAAVQMIVFVTIAGALRPGYDSSRNWISQLSLGPGGPLATANLGTCGLWLIVAGLGLRSKILVVVSGLCLASLAFIRTDAGIGYPPDVPTTHTTHGLVHQVIAVVMGFAGVGAAAALGGTLPFRHGRLIGRTVAALMAVAFTTGSVLVLLDAANVWPGNPSGLFERVAMYAGLGWIAVVSGWAAWGSSGTDPAASGRTSNADRERARAGPAS